MKKIAIYVRVSSPDQHVESQLYDLRELAAQRGFEVVHEYEDRGVSGQKARRPGLDPMMMDARRKRFSVVLVAAFDRIARSTKNFLQVVDELDSLGVEFISRREGVATGDAMGRLFVTIISAIAELERSLVIERVKSGMRRAKLEGRQIGRARLDVDREQVVCDRRTGMSLTPVARKHAISRASVCRLMKEANSNSNLVAAASSDEGMHEAQIDNMNIMTNIPKVQIRLTSAAELIAASLEPYAQWIKEMLGVPLTEALTLELDCNPGHMVAEELLPGLAVVAGTKERNNAWRTYIKEWKLPSDISPRIAMSLQRQRQPNAAPVQVWELDWQDCPVAFKLRGLKHNVVSAKIPVVFPPGDMPVLSRYRRSTGSLCVGRMPRKYCY
jgi:DNA invertase Pin-like site-specific DNA recombinase